MSVQKGSPLERFLFWMQAAKGEPIPEEYLNQVIVNGLVALAEHLGATATDGGTSGSICEGGGNASEKGEPSAGEVRVVAEVLRKIGLELGPEAMALAAIRALDEYRRGRLGGS